MNIPAVKVLAIAISFLIVLFAILYPIWRPQQHRVPTINIIFPTTSCSSVQSSITQNSIDSQNQIDLLKLQLRDNQLTIQQIKKSQIKDSGNQGQEDNDCLTSQIVDLKTQIQKNKQIIRIYQSSIQNEDKVEGLLSQCDRAYKELHNAAKNKLN